MADVIDSACDACAAAVVFGTSLEPHGRLTPLFHTPHAPCPCCGQGAQGWARRVDRRPALAICYDSVRVPSPFKVPKLADSVTGSLTTRAVFEPNKSHVHRRRLALAIAPDQPSDGCTARERQRSISRCGYDDHVKDYLGFFGCFGTGRHQRLRHWRIGAERANDFR